MHRGNWSLRTATWLRRLDHSSIFLLIAGSYTPFTLLLLEGRERATLLAIAWGGALLGILFRLFWVGAPRWLYTPIYIALGWAAVFYFPAFFESASAAVISCLVVGGALYTVGGVDLRLPVAGPVTALVRLPRGVPHAHDRGLRDPLRRGLDRDVLPALRPGSDTPRTGLDGPRDPGVPSKT